MYLAGTYCYRINVTAPPGVPLGDTTLISQHIHIKREFQGTTADSVFRRTVPPLTEGLEYEYWGVHWGVGITNST